MATDFGIRIIMDENGVGGVTSDEVAKVVQKAIQLLAPETLVITNAVSYTGGNRAYNVSLSLNTITTADYGIEILVDATVSTNRKVAILYKILNALSIYTLTLVLVATYAAGTTSTNQNTITVT